MIENSSSRLNDEMTGVKGGGIHEIMNTNGAEGSVIATGNRTADNAKGAEGSVAGTGNSNGGCVVNKKRRLVKSSCNEDEKEDNRLADVKVAEVVERPANATSVSSSESCDDGCVVKIKKEVNKEAKNKRAEVGKLEPNPWSTLFPSLKRGIAKTKPSEGGVVPEMNPSERKGMSETKPSEREGMVTELQLSKKQGVAETTETKTKRDGKVSPIKSDNVLKDEIWKVGEPVPFSALCKTLKDIEDTSSRLDITEILRRFFLSVILLTPQDLEACVYLACGKIAPAYEGMELGVGDTILMKAIALSTGGEVGTIKSKLESIGDLGEVAQNSRKRQNKLLFAAKPKSLTIYGILESFRRFSQITGSKSQDRKVTHLQKLLVAAVAEEARYIVRFMQGKLRVGLQESTVLVALAEAIIMHPKQAPNDAENDIMVNTTKDALGNNDQVTFEMNSRSQKEVPSSTTSLSSAYLNARALEDRLKAGTELLKQAYSECPNYSTLVKALLSHPLERLPEFCRLSPGVPVVPMLAKPTKWDDMSSRMKGQLFTCEYKYDGERGQIHYLPDGSMKLFSRNQEDMTSKYPELPAVLGKARKEDVTSFVLDCEIVAYDRNNCTMLPFQILSTRKRKDEKIEDIKVAVIFQLFDILYLNGENLLRKQLQERREYLKSAFVECPGELAFATTMDYQENGDTAPLEEFLAQSVKVGAEGLMIKTLENNASYEPSKRSLNWLKLKKDYLNQAGGCADSLDLVPIGAFWGKGKRTGIFGSYLLACYDPDSEEYQSTCKIGTGFSDEQLKEYFTMFSDLQQPFKPSYFNVDSSLSPDVWFKPTIVLEVKAADLSISPVHKAAIGKCDKTRNKGISIRFPRLLRIRHDKPAEEATSATQILQFYFSQDLVVSSRKSPVSDDEFEF